VRSFAEVCRGTSLLDDVELLHHAIVETRNDPAENQFREMPGLAVGGERLSRSVAFQQDVAAGVIQLTPRGQATRERIVEAAAGLMYTHGVHATNNDLVRKAANVNVNGSQLSHYFPDKESLVRAVIVWRADSMMGLRETPPRGALDSFEALRA
jgi:Bacterial regulatory proteins, tetR family